MWKVTIRGTLIYLIAINLIIFSLNTVVQTKISREFYVWLGIFGTILVMISLGYIPIKYLFRSVNRLKTWLYIHMIAGGVGAVIILLHSELHLKSFLPAVTLILMELVAFTGVIGRYLFIYTAQKLHHEAVIKKVEEFQEQDGDYVLLALTTKTLRTWRWFHVQLSWLLLMLTLIHVITEFIWRGLRL